MNEKNQNSHDIYSIKVADVVTQFKNLPEKSNPQKIFHFGVPMLSILLIIVVSTLICLVGMTTADILPQAIPENQVFSVVSDVEGVSMVYERTTLTWEVGDKGLDELAAPYYKDGKILSGSIAYVRYKDVITTNGGQISEVKSFSMDTHKKTEGLYNIETTKVLTYASQNGSHLMGAESYLLDVAGNWSRGFDNLVCVFANAKKEIIPAFCNKVTASSKLTSVTTAQVETVGGLTAIAEKRNVPAALNYEISVTPDANAAFGYADGIVSTMFTVSVMEGRDDGAVRDNLVVYNSHGGVLHDGFWLVDSYPSAGGDLIAATWTGTQGSPLNVFYVGISRDTTGQTTQCINTNLRYGGRMYPYVLNSCPSSPGLLNTGYPPDAGITIAFVGEGIYDVVVTKSYEGLEVGTYNINLNQGVRPVSNVITLGPLPGWIPLFFIEPYLEHYDELASTMTHIDTATVAGGISTFTKEFKYQSGISCVNC